ncbi:peptidase M61 [Hydrogenophaga sp. 5NK40-0174]|uniref:M61 family metallopeptidase n=1 Tax=Hydrogenophaga sp. 5NK40-0174 TaxID=3127649 RepID=UPI003101DAE9
MPAASTKPSASTPRGKRPKAGIHYTVSVKRPASHLFEVVLVVDAPATRQKLSLPVWIPGSYLVREFSQHLQNLRATQGREAVRLKQLDKHTWMAEGVQPGKPLKVSCEVYAFDASVRTAYLDVTRGFFNPTATCLRVHGREDEPCTLTLERGTSPDGWQAATALKPQRCDADGFGRYLASHYDELADSPVELGVFWSGEFTVRGVPHRFVVSGTGAWFDGDRLLADTRKIVETQMAFWHGPDGKPPFDRYLFMLFASGTGYGGLEHRYSTALICQRNDLPRKPTSGEPSLPKEPKVGDGYTTLLGLISHEYFHTWNVKRLRPAEFARYDYGRENYTELLWFFEGFTSYYDDLFLRRAGLVDDATYLKLFAKSLNQVLQTPGRHIQSLAQASYDAWVKYYRVGENTPNATVSYYTKGALLALCIDQTLRQKHGSTLDEVMRALWARCGDGPLKESDVRAVLQQLSGGKAFNPLLDQWIHGRNDLPVDELLKGSGVKVSTAPAPLAQRLGLRVQEQNGIVTVKTVLRGGAADEAGLAAGDEWLGVELPPAKRGQASEAWRVNELKDLELYLHGRSSLTALVSRDKQLLRLPMSWPAPAKVVRLAVDQEATVRAWLNG